jgi:hypothetical protein
LATESVARYMRILRSSKCARYQLLVNRKPDEYSTCMEKVKYMKPIQKRSATFSEARDPEGVENVLKI